MKCFVSGRSSNFSEIVRVTQLLRGAGHEITHDWTTLPMVKPYQDNADQAGEYAVLQIRGIAEADVYIILAHEDGTGLFAELGAALALAQFHGKPSIYAVAPVIPAAIFHYHPAIRWFTSVEEVMVAIGQS